MASSLYLTRIKSIALIRPATIQHLRFPFSFLLLPVSLFALSCAEGISWYKAIAGLLLVHLLLYPASNGYNSYMDRDEGSIGGVEHPLPVDRQLYYVTLLMDAAGLLLALLLDPRFGILYGCYVIFSRLYSYRGIRLKQYPIIGYLTVALNQGALVFAAIYLLATGTDFVQLPLEGLVVSTLLIGAFYPITQIYQHEQDRKDGVRTMSMLLGIRGTFLYCALLYTIAFALLASWYYSLGHFAYFIILQLFFLPVIVWFLRWLLQSWKDAGQASYRNTMRMNWLAAAGTNTAFLTLILYRHFG